MPRNGPRPRSTTKPPPVVPRDDGYVRVRGAREHNLKDVDVDLPREALVVVSGFSGSGKSSLAFGTLYAEAQRRYFDSVSPYARRLIDQVGVPDVDTIVKAVAGEAEPGDLIVVMSNGGFGGIHRKLLEALT